MGKKSEGKPNRHPALGFWMPHARMIVLILAFYLISHAAMPYVLSLGGFGYLGAFAISLVSSASIILPTPGFVAIFEMGRFLDPVALGIAAGIGSTIGELTSYYAGKAESKKLQEHRIYRQNEDAIRKYGPAAMFLLALVPNPALDLAGIACGATGMKLWMYLASVGAAKIIKYTFLAYSGLWTVGIIG